MSKRFEKVTAITGALMLALAVLGTLWAAASSGGASASVQQQHSGRLADHESRLRSSEATQAAIKNDVRWIRERMEEDRKRK